MAEIDDFIRAVEFVTGRAGKKAGKQTRLLCPAHPDRNPSLYVTEGDTGAILAKCWSQGCTWEQICTAIGWLRAPKGDDSEEWTPHGPAVAVYDYVDAGGELLYQVCRTADKQFPQRRPDAHSKSGWKWNLDGVERVLYRLPAVLAQAAAGGPIYVCEGEKDVHALESLGLVATCNPGGAGKWRNAYNEFLRGAQVIVVADDDPPGRQHARSVADALTAGFNGAAPAVQIVKARVGKDAHDHVSAGFGSDDFDPLELTESLLRFVSMAAFAAVVEDSSAPLAVDEAGGAVIPADGFVLVYGDGGAGKTTLCIDLACHLATEREWLGIVRPERALRVALVENEGPRAMFRDKLRAKLEAGWEDAGEGVIVLEEPWQGLSFEDEAQRDEMVRTLAEQEIDMLMAGPLSRLGMKGGGTLDEIASFDGQVRDVQRRMPRPLTVLLVHHENRAGQVSGAWEGVPDSLVHVQAQGHGKTRVFWQKLRWAPFLHLKTTHLVWADGAGFAVADDEEQLTDAQVMDRIVEYVREHPGAKAGELAKAKLGRSGQALIDLRTALLKPPGARLVNAGSGDRFELYTAEAAPVLSIPDSE